MLARSRLGRLLVLLALSLTALAAAAGSALAAWSASSPVSVPINSGGDVQEDAEYPALAVAPDGDALAVWRDLELGRNNRAVFGARAGAAGAFSGRTPFAGGASTAEGRPAVALNSAGAAVVAWAEGSIGAEVVKASYRPAGGSFSGPVTVSATGKDANAPAVAISASGKAVVVWSAGLGEFEEDFAEASVHGPSGGFSAGQVINRNEDEGAMLPMQARVAIDGSGNATVVYPSTRPGGLGVVIPLQWAYMPAGASSFGAPTDLPEGMTPDLAVTSGGRATVAWQKDGKIFAAEQSAAGGSFGSAKEASDSGDGSASKPAVGVDGAGNATVAYQAGAGSTAVFLATRPSNGDFGTPLRVSSSGNSGDASVAVAPGGAAAAAWTRFNGSKQTVEASYRPAAGAFAAAELLSKSGSTPIAAGLAAAGIDASGNATVLWQRMEFWGIVFAATFTGGDGGEPPTPPDNGGGGGGGTTPPNPAPPAVTPPAATPAATPPPAKKPAALKCKKGFKKQTAKGKTRCVKIKKKVAKKKKGR